MKKRIESETSTKIIIPRINEQGDIGEDWYSKAQTKMACPNLIIL